jgi:membrane protein required for colicin V production
MDSLLSGLNIIDYLIIAILFLSILIGFTRGLISELTSLLTLIAAFAVAIAFTTPLANYFNQTSVVQDAVNHTTSAVGTSTATAASYTTICVSFAILFFATLIVGGLIKMILNAFVQRGFIAFGNRILGAVFGLLRGFLFVIALIFLVQLSPFAKEDWWVQSKFVPYFAPQVAWLGSVVSPALDNMKSSFSSIIDGTKGALNQLGGKANNAIHQ